MHLSKKQYEALGYLEDQTTNELLYGGAAGGGKSVLGCYWQLKRRFKYPGTRGLIGRSVLKTLKETTIKSLFEVMKIQGITSNFYNYNQQACEIKFANKSEIIFKDLATNPSDPNFDELGSLEITDCFIDEATQISEKAKNIVKSRIRFKLDEYNLIPKILYTSNPGRGWLYSDIFKPYKDNKLPENKKFVQAFLTDNPYISEFYEENLKGLDKESRQRLLHGDWEYQPEGYLFDEEKLNYFDLKDIDINKAVLIDFTDVADEGDCYHSNPIGAIIGSRVYIIDWLYTQKPIEHWKPIYISNLKKYNLAKSLFESNNMGLMATKFIKDSLEKVYSDKIIALPETTNKDARIKITGETDIIPNFYFLRNRPPMYEEAMQHLFQYRLDGKFKPKDAPDSLAGLSKYTVQYRAKIK